MATSQQSTENEVDLRSRYPTADPDGAHPYKISQHEQARKTVSLQPPTEDLLGDQRNVSQRFSSAGIPGEDTQSKLQHPNLIKLIEAQLQDYSDNSEGNKYQDKHQKRENTDLDSVIQQVFSGNSIQEHKTRDLSHNPYSDTESQTNIKKRDSFQKLPRSKTYEKSNTPDAFPKRKILKRKRLLKRLRPPMFRSSQTDTNSMSEQNSEELLHNILESIDQENTENGNPVKNAFITKTVTYNISKIHNLSKNRNFLIEKLINYSTNINMLHAENIPTNYSDTHSSVLQTVINLDQQDENTDDFLSSNSDETYRYFQSENNLSKEVDSSYPKSGVTNEGEMLGKSPDNHQPPTEFLGGQYLQHPNKYNDLISKQTERKNNIQEPSDFVGGQFINIDEKIHDSQELKEKEHNMVDFVGGQFVKQPLKPDYSRNVDEYQRTTDDNTTPTTTVETHTNKPLTVIPSASLVKESSVEDVGLYTPIPQIISYNNKKPTGLFDPQTKTMKPDKKGYNTAEVLKETLEKTTDVYDDSLLDDSTSTYEKPNDKKKLLSLTENSGITTPLMEVTTTPGSTKNAKSNENFLGLPISSIEIGESQSASFEERELSYTDSEEDIGTSKEFSGVKPTNSYVMRNNLVTEKTVLEENDEYNSSEYTTTENSFEEVQSVSTSQPTFSSESRFDRELDHVVGEASDIQQNITGRVDDVKLYAGKAMASESPENQSTSNYDPVITHKNPLGIENNDSGEKNTTEICIPLTKENYPTLLELLTGNLYLENNGKRVKLKISGDPMKYCHSGTKICKLFYDMEKSTEPSISEEMFEIIDDSIDDGGLNSKSKNGKRHITEEYTDLIKSEQNADVNTHEKNENTTAQTEIRKYLTHKNENITVLPVNKTVNDQSFSDFKSAGSSEFTEPPNSLKSLPVESVFIRLPVPYKSKTYDDQNSNKENDDNPHEVVPQTNEEKITLYNLDTPYHKLGFPKGTRLVRKIHQKRDSHGHVGGACGCNNPLLLSPNPVPDYRHFVGKRLAILTNIAHTVKDWAIEEALRP